MSLKSVVVDLYVWDGTVSDQPVSPAYTINKSVISGQTNITLEIAELVRDYFTITFNNDYNSIARYVRTVVSSFDDSDEPFETNPIVTTYVALDGYGYFEEGTNPELDRHALISATNIYLPEGTAGKLPIFAEGVGKVIIDGVTTQITDNGNTNQKVQYVTIPADKSSIQVFDTDDTTLKKTITISNICEPKYTPFKITFVNKFGAFQDLYFFKKTSEVTNVTDELFKKNIITNTSSNYNTYDNQRGRMNVNAQTSLSMNTGFVKEDMNQTIEELFYSENVYIRYENKTLAVIPKSKSLQYKTSLNDKLINYTVEFDFAFDRINNVR
ncbi:MAG: hypothetical protein Tp1111SUR761211_41 [Prokaryotic dsDNA virus sp.]|nr:MAG: hypothetical protein Tp1111SUR761211_41 [Prokaryotic dsDNA virus sp.]|tara:strand:+ start:22916 stop:23896 length:981 start_codon:yes stop_codon:yes gene_type:complete